jgi:hypothetical protein
LGSIAVFGTSLTLNSGPKSDLTCEILVISADGAVSDDPCDEQPASKQALPIATAILITRVNLVQGPQARNADTVFTNRSAANCGVSGECDEPGSLISAVNA